jgi:hypothetical protein
MKIKQVLGSYRNEVRRSPYPDHWRTYASAAMLPSATDARQANGHGTKKDVGR